MSILMDALKQQQPPVATPSNFWRNLAIALALILAIAVGFLAGYLLLPQQNGQTILAKLTASTETEAAPALSSQPVPEVKTPEKSDAAVKNVTPEVAETTASATDNEATAVASESLPPEPAVVTVTTDTPKAEPVDDPEVSAELRQRFASALEDSAEQRGKSSTFTTHSAPAQDISMLDITLQRQLPKLRFEAHVYATQPAQRWVKVNGKSLQEGQWITSDVRLKEITPQYVLLEFGQQLFSMRALSEW